MLGDPGTYVAAARFALIAHTTATKVKTIAVGSCHQSKVTAKAIQNNAAATPFMQQTTRICRALTGSRELMNI